MNYAENEKAPKNEQFIIPDDGCRYYKFLQFSKIGKYDPQTGCYYLLTDHMEWKLSGAVMRWVIDAAYDFIELAPRQSVSIGR